MLFGGLEGRVEKLEAENAHLFNVTNLLAKRLAELEKLLDGQIVTAAVPVSDSKPAAKPAAKPVAKKEESHHHHFLLSWRQVLQQVLQQACYHLQERLQ